MPLWYHNPPPHDTYRKKVNFSQSPQLKCHERRDGIKLTALRWARFPERWSRLRSQLRRKSV